MPNLSLVMAAALIGSLSAEESKQPDDHCGSQRSPRHFVYVEIPPGLDPLSRIAPALVELFDRLDLSPCVLDVPDPESPSAGQIETIPGEGHFRIRIVRDNDGVTVLGTHTSWRRVTERRVRFEQLDEIAAEEIAHVVFTIVEAQQAGLSEGRPLASGRPNLETTPADNVIKTKDSPQGPSPREYPWEVLVRHGGQYDGGTVRHETGVRFYRIGDHARVMPTFWWGVSATWPHTIASKPIHLQSNSTTADMGMALRFNVSPRASLCPGVSMALQRTTVDPSPGNTSQALAGPSRSNYWPVLQAEIGTKIQISQRVHLMVAPSFGLDLRGRRYVLQGSGQQVVVSRPWRLQLGLWAGGGFSF